MMKMKRILKGLALVFLIMQSTAVYGQSQVSISGRVADAATGESLPGVNIRVKDKVIGTITNAKGDFSLTVNQSAPLVLVFSYVGYTPQEISITEANVTGLEVKMEEQVIFGQDVVVSASRVEESILRSPVSIEKLDILDIRNTASASFYEGLATLKGVDFSTQSITFKSINMRGFGANGNTRFVQLIDGIDNQAPGLNFAVGNIVGINDLDLESAELQPGASSALYGPNAINGILLLTSKNPFEYQGLSVYAKTGVNHVDERDDNMSLYQDYGFRYAKAYNNKLAFKVTASYLSANDFIGVDTRDQGLATGGVVERGATERGNNRFYDGVNTYGDFGITVGRIADGAIAGGNTSVGAIRSLFPDDQSGYFTPTGFSESSFVDNTTESVKIGGALHYRLNDNLELLGQFNYGSGSTVYTANDRFVLDNFSITTAKLELKGSEFYLRGYTTQENSGDTYAANTLASLINQQTYLSPYLSAFAGARLAGASIEQAHASARVSADAAQPQPGSAAFEALVESNRAKPISEGGALFLDKTDLYHMEGNWNLSDRIDFADVIVGANYRRYALYSEGTLFALENDGSEVAFNEYGAFLQASKSVANDNLTFQGSVRYDKNEYFKGQLSPRVSAVGTIADNHNVRASFQRGFRIPTTQDQFIDLDVVTRRLVGSNDLLVDRYNFKTNTVYTTESVDAARAAGNEALLVIEDRVNNEFKTEKVNTFEIGYKGLFADGKLLVDAYYYNSTYTDFIAEIDFTQAVPNGLRQPNSDAGTQGQRQQIVDGTVPTQRYGFDVNADGKVKSQGWALQLDYQIGNGYEIGANVAYNELTSQDDLIAQGFAASYNTPKYRYNIKFSNRKVTDRLGFNVTYRWQQAFLWESSFGTGVIPEFGSLDAQVSYKVPTWKSTFKIGASNLLNERYTTSFGNPSLGGIYYFQITFDEFFN
ncbi:TonB-dependent receptor [Roseivirga sp.]|uniref:TonB-dependent receptor n=1 Tax=Roseivirga sp. TaxID=1964215 RepID=UPI002B2694D3|nr:TonB-dependent receptor [Roseivirga sp.]